VEASHKVPESLQSYVIYCNELNLIDLADLFITKGFSLGRIGHSDPFYLSVRAQEIKATQGITA